MSCPFSTIIAILPGILYSIISFLLPSFLMGCILTILLSSSIPTTFPSVKDITASPFGALHSKISSILGKPCVISPAPTIPPKWCVLSVNWVPGSPIACAATIPTASPIFIKLFLPKSHP